ncbi:MAG: hypothetical protein ABEL04_00825 [Salinibacter sp.]|uniref:hypothetical protein n=1 Tax=Salinibacter sp. TaxID=2065818 RepID=UPI0035D4493C
MGQITRASVIKTWGIAVLIGWLGSQAISSLAPSGWNVPAAITTLWLVGALLPITVSLFWDRPTSADQTLSLVWPALGVTGILLNFGVSLGALPSAETIEVLAYGVLWFAGPGLGFAITAASIDSPSAPVYGWAAALNFGAALAAFVAPFALLPAYFIGAAVLQAGPMLYDGFSG